jgi:hypothetical protein
VGLDFISRCTPTFQRLWDTSRVALSEPDLFRRHPEIQRTFLLVAEAGWHFQQGEDLNLREDNGTITAWRGLTHVGTVRRPPAPLGHAVAEEGGVLCVRVGRVHTHSGNADVTIVL